MRLVFLGSDAFAVPTLEALLASDHTVARVFTQPDRPAGRGRQERVTPVKHCAQAHGLDLVQPATLKRGAATPLLEAVEPDLAVVVAYGHLIPPDMLAVPTHGCINAHASLLPKYRGAAPVPHAILAGETETGVTAFRLNERFDAGEMLGRRVVPIQPDDTSGALLDRLAPVAASLVLEVVAAIAEGRECPLPQTEAQATKAPKLKKEAGEIDWSASRAHIDRRVRSFQPWPLAYTFVPAPKGRRRLTVLAVSLPDAAANESLLPGTVVRADPKQGLIVQCGDGALRLDAVRPEGRSTMTGPAFVRGANLDAGTRLG